MARLRHLAYTGGWNKFETLWDLVIKTGHVARFGPLLERVLQGSTRSSMGQAKVAARRRPEQGDSLA